ncbi:hypothetical protein AVEN_168982-1 [Araneus ventricosus]|uniref:Uncharacterized protein n=1 Tax=Araneus ventricosus TaxID=182803 RepID=A0A4Y2VZA9_ARAVE|nr:hypothetical protein AVEN_63929-1 [Araneus ventricosus]GBN79527.1 hypothetical protein AVEN_41353-1 [Araneus ventricosus]GBO29107.1 hypothetical protein AVEN_156860-1 [Araneus ventricosus]GBO29114.1 hypothetical protein AVEN_168982-1 [Araneus ventricosus]
MPSFKQAKCSSSQLFQNGIFVTGEGKNNRQGRNAVKFKANDSEWWNSKELKIQNSIRRFQFETSIRGSGTSKDLPTLGPRVEGRNETRSSRVRGRRG